MALFYKAKQVLGRYNRDESGTMAMSWALSATIMLGAMGAALDFSMLANADKRAQSIADTTALAAAIYVKNHEVKPANRNDGLLGNYTAQELGYEFRNWVINAATGVTVEVEYDDVNRQATATVSGKTKPVLVHVFGYDKLNFSAKTVVNYYEQEMLDPASIVMILDNSGSMHFDDQPLDETGNRPATAQPRIDGLETGAKNLMTMLDTTVGPQDGSTGLPKVLRTGMMAFSSDIIPSRTVNMKWGTLSDANIDAMTPGGATNSAPPLTIANTWLNVNEPPVHAVESPGKTPLKYIILMTDGKNTVGTEEWVAREGTENWRAWVQTGTSTEWSDDREVVNAYVSGGSCRWQGGHPAQDYTYFGSWGYNVTYSNTTWRVECYVEEEVPEYGWVYMEQENMPTEPGDWEEGEFDITSNILTRAECDTLHASGVEIFSIAYALQPGDYPTNQWGIDNYGNADYTYTTTAEDANKARGILQYCASEPQNFITANDTSALDAAFTRIGNDIVKEIIRISS